MRRWVVLGVAAVMCAVAVASARAALLALDDIEFADFDAPR